MVRIRFPSLPHVVWSGLTKWIISSQWPFCAKNTKIDLPIVESTDCVLHCLFCVSWYLNPSHTQQENTIWTISVLVIIFFLLDRDKVWSSTICHRLFKFYWGANWLKLNKNEKLFWTHTNAIIISTFTPWRNIMNLSTGWIEPPCIHTHTHITNIIVQLFITNYQNSPSLVRICICFKFTFILMNFGVLWKTTVTVT